MEHLNPQHAAAAVKLSDDMLGRIDEIVPPGLTPKPDRQRLDQPAAEEKAPPVWRLLSGLSRQMWPSSTINSSRQAVRAEGIPISGSRVQHGKDSRQAHDGPAAHSSWRTSHLKVPMTTPQFSPRIWTLFGYPDLMPSPGHGLIWLSRSAAYWPEPCRGGARWFIEARSSDHVMDLLATFSALLNRSDC
jgi:hypothetical protein